MKNSLLLCIAILISGNIYSQSKKVKSFDGISISGSVTAEIISSDKEYVEYEIVKGNAEDLIIMNKGNTLIVKIKSSGTFGRNTQAVVKIYYTNINDLEVSSGSSATVASTIDVDKFGLEVSSGSNCTLDLVTNHSDIEVSSGSSLHISGESDHTELEVSSGSSFKGEKYSAKEVDVEVSSGSSSRITVTDTIDGEVSSGSSLKYFGNPSHSDVDKDISSSVSGKY